MTTINIKQKISSEKIKTAVKAVVDGAKTRIDSAEKTIRETKKPEVILAEAKAKADEIKNNANASAAKLKADADKLLAENQAILRNKQNELIAANNALADANAKNSRAQQINGLLKITRDFTRIWWDKGSGGKIDLALYKPLPASGYAILGHTGYPGYGSLKSDFGVLTFKLDNGFIKWKHPVDYERIWKDSGSGADQDGAIWKPIPPPGYVAMGMMASRGHSNKPSLTAMVCIEEKFTYTGKVTKDNLLWKDVGTGADRDVSLWINPQLGTYWSHASHSVPGGSVFRYFDLDKIRAALG